MQGREGPRKVRIEDAEENERQKEGKGKRGRRGEKKVQVHSKKQG